MRDVHFIILLLAVTILLFSFGLGNFALTDPDETFYAQSAKEMLSADEWVTPMIFGKPQFEKPILYYWLVMLSYMLFGINEFAARFPSVIFGIAGVIGVYFLGRFLFSRLCGFLSGLILATCAQYIVLARGCVTDIVLSVFILYCLLFFLTGWTTGKKGHYIIASVMAALAVLTKGPIGLFIPGMVVILYIIFSRQWRKLKDVPVFWCALVFLAVCLPWYIQVMRVHGSAFTDDFFFFRNITRFLEPEHAHSETFLFYIPVFLVGFFPWSLFLPFGTWDMSKSGGDASPVKAHRVFLLIWFLTVFLFFSVSKTKLVTYIMPAYPVAALVAGRFWERFLSAAGDRGSRLRKHMNISYYSFIACSFGLLAGMYFLVRYKYAQALSGAALTGIVFGAGLLLSLILFARDRRRGAFFAIIAAVMLLCVPLVIYVLPVIEEFETSKALSLKVKEISSPDEPLGGECDHRRGIAFYSGRTEIEDIHPYASLKSFVSRKGRVWGIIQKKHYRQLKDEVGEAVARPVAQSGEYVLITNKPLED